MKKTDAEIAEALVDNLFSDMNDRSFDTGMVDAETLAEWKGDWAERVLLAIKKAKEP